MIFLPGSYAQCIPRQVGRKAAIEGKNDARARWRRNIFLAGRLEDGNSVPIDPLNPPFFDAAGAEEGALMPRKTMETQHWLELIDGYVLGPIQLLSLLKIPL